MPGYVVRPGSQRQVGRSSTSVGLDSDKSDWAGGRAVGSRKFAAGASQSDGHIGQHDSLPSSSAIDQQGHSHGDQSHSNGFQPVQNAAQIDALEHKREHEHGHHRQNENGYEPRHNRSYTEGHAQGHTHTHDHAHGHSPESDHTHDHEHDHGQKAGHSHGHGHENGHSHSHGGHSHGGVEAVHDPNRLQAAILAIAKALRWYQLANFLRESLPVAFGASALLLCSFLVPRVLPTAVGAKIGTALVTAVFGLIGTPALLDSMVDLAGGHINIHVLMALAAFASVAMGSPLEGALLLCLFTVSHAAEDALIERAQTDVSALEELSPESALVLSYFDPAHPPAMNALVSNPVPLKTVARNSFVLVRAGETVPLDGVVVMGKSTCTLEHLTGESTPVVKKKGDSVPGGAQNLEGLLIVKVEKVWSDSTVARIVRLTAEAAAGRPKLQKWVDEFGEKYSQVVVVLSALVGILGPVLFGWPLSGRGESPGAIYRALGLMVAMSPCALAAAPLSYVAGISACARKGVLLRGGQALDALARCDTVAFDKTGTLTTGELRCTSIQLLHGYASEETASGSPAHGEALAVAAALEQAATHPIARAVLEHARGKALPNVTLEDFRNIPGEGLTARVTTLTGQQKTVKLGTIEFVSEGLGADAAEGLRRAVEREAEKGKESVMAAMSVGSKVSLFLFEDKVRPAAAGVIAFLRGVTRLHTVMLTGDHEASAAKVARVLGLEKKDVFAGLKPEDKLRHVVALSARGGKSGGLIMVGDGINDAPALAAATVGVVLAERASATATAAADVLLLQDDMEGVSFAVAKARQTLAVVKQSIFFALLCMSIAAVPAVSGIIPLWLTVIVHEGSTVLVSLNALRVLRNPKWRIEGNGSDSEESEGEAGDGVAVGKGYNAAVA
ncbi:hypothetical protein KFL_004420010 [Klebsormidium nitens]|uniref:P-type ATPase A domain-containing protein n=1 Tax=Klebsormidium nitens TaxID=105231 RepID=A0A1Y1IIN5_KLENI|nr:hypothetical protein KFL_004420010 [Klebsormidium nitens]|eukprot:GAQ88586.1 hypothetical protein KFL_004420010 [Klebsormidium nitens]